MREEEVRRWNHGTGGPHCSSPYLPDGRIQAPRQHDGDKGNLAWTDLTFAQSGECKGLYIHTSAGYGL